MVDFYYAYYQRQTLNKNGEWEDKLYDHQLIVVVASNYDEAKYKIFNCLDKMKDYRYRAVLSSDIKEAAGIDFIYDFRGDLCISPIEEN